MLSLLSLLSLLTLSIGLRKIFMDYFFFQADQWDCTKSLSIFNRFASSEQRFRTCQICRLSVSHSKVRTACLPAKSFGILASHGKGLSRPRPNYFFFGGVFPIMILLAYSILQNETKRKHIGEREKMLIILNTFQENI